MPLNIKWWFWWHEWDNSLDQDERHWRHRHHTWGYPPPTINLPIPYQYFLLTLVVGGSFWITWSISCEGHCFLNYLLIFFFRHHSNITSRFASSAWKWATQGKNPQPDGANGSCEFFYFLTQPLSHSVCSLLLLCSRIQSWEWNALYYVFIAASFYMCSLAWHIQL